MQEKIEKIEKEVPLKVLLIVDDEEEVRKLLMEYFQRQGFLVLEAENGELALKVITDNIIPDAVITDLMMPKMNGLELCHSIRNHPDERIRSLPVIILSGEDPEIHRPVAESAGANLFLEKPVNPKKLRDEIKKILGLRKEED